MGIKGKLLALVMTLVLMLAVAASAGAVVKYDVTLPSNYSSNTAINYPVIYVMPEDGFGSHSNNIAGLINGTNGIKAIFVKPTFSAGMDLYAETQALVAEIDSKYRTIENPTFRAVVGNGTGAYMAYILAMTDSTGEMQATPSLFGFVAGIDGNYTHNVWNKKYGDLYSKLEAAEASIYNEYFCYMDSYVGSEWVNLEGSSNNIGQLFMDSGCSPAVLEYTVRRVDSKSEFLKESASRVADRMASFMLGSFLTGSASLEKTVMPAADKNATVSYTINLKDAAADIFNRESTIVVRVASIDPNTGDVLATSSENLKVSGAGTYTGDISLANKINGKSSNVELSVSLLNADLTLATVNMLREQDPVFDGEYQHIDLMGDWYFNWVGPSITIDVSTLTSSEYKTWSVVQPGLGNWDEGYGNVTKELVFERVPYASYVAQMYGIDYCITGAGYYVKEIDLSSEFTAKDVVLSIGNIDDRCEVFVNGTRVGATGMDESGKSTGEATWDVYSAFTVDASLLKPGEKNTIVVRAWNDTSFGAGGWYSGPIGLYSQYAFDNPRTEESITGDSDRFYEETFYSDALGADNQYLIYLPKNYENSNQFYPTMYLLHQFNSTHTSYRVDAIDQYMDDGIAKGLFDEMIVVVPNSSSSSFWAGEYETMVLEDLIPHIEANYRAIPDARYRMTAGCSMGGYGAFALAQRNPNYFSGLVSFYGAIDDRYAPDDAMVEIADKTSSDYLNYFSIAFICGNQDSWGFDVPAIDLNKKYEEMGVDHYFFIENGDHDSAFYLQYFQDSVKYVRDNMYKNTSGSAASLFGVEYIASSKELVATFTADEAIRKYFNVIPASSFTKNTNPGITLPVVATIKYEVKPGALAFLYSTALAETKEAQVKFFVTFDDNNLIVTENVDLSGVVPAGAVIHDVDFHTQLLGRDTKADGEKVEELKVNGETNLPATGDNSNIMLFAALLMMSIIGMTVMGKKKASC